MGTSRTVYCALVTVLSMWCVGSVNLCAQKNSVPDPIDYAVELANSSHFIEEEAFLLRLIKFSPRNFFAYHLLWDDLAHTKSQSERTARIEADLKFFYQIPHAQRTEFFYLSYEYGLKSVGRLHEEESVMKEDLNRFPKGMAMRQLLLEQAARATSPQVGDRLYQRIMIEYRKLPALVIQAAQKDFELRKDHPDQFTNMQVHAAAEVWRQAQARDSSNSDPGYQYLALLETLGQYYLHVDARRTLYYCELSSTYIEQTASKTKLYGKDYVATYWPMELRANLELKQWEQAFSVGSQLELPLANGNLGGYHLTRFQEAEIRGDYAKALEMTVRLDAAFMQFGVESVLDPSRLGDLSGFTKRNPQFDLRMDVRMAAWKEFVAQEVASRDVLLTADILRNEINARATPFILPTLDGGEISLSALRGKPVVLFFWASWCDYCQQEMKQLSELSAANAQQAFSVVAVSVDVDRDAAKKIFNNAAPNFDVAFADAEVEDEYGTSMVPQLYVLDANGNIRFHIKGTQPDFGKSLKIMLMEANKPGLGGPSPAAKDPA